MYKTRFAGTFPLAPAAKENRDNDSLLSYYPRTLRQGKVSQFARRMRAMDGTGCPSLSGLAKWAERFRNHRLPYSSGGAAKPALSLSKGAFRRASKRAPSPGEFPAAEPRFTPSAAVLRHWPRKSLPYEYTDTTRQQEVAKRGPREARSCASWGVWRPRAPFFPQPTTDSCQLSFFGGRVSSCHRELIEPARA